MIGSLTLSKVVQNTLIVFYHLFFTRILRARVPTANIQPKTPDDGDSERNQGFDQAHRSPVAYSMFIATRRVQPRPNVLNVDRLA